MKITNSGKTNQGVPVGGKRSQKKRTKELVKLFKALLDRKSFFINSDDTIKQKTVECRARGRGIV